VERRRERDYLKRDKHIGRVTHENRVVETRYTHRELE